MFTYSGDIASWKAGIYGKSFQCRTGKLGLCSSLCACGMCLGEGWLIISFARNTAWVAKRNHWELSQGCPCMFTRWWRNHFSCQLPHCLTLFSPPPRPESCVHLVDSCKAGFYTSTKMSLKILYCSEEGWHQWLVDLFPLTSICLSVCLSVCLSWC